MERFDRGLVLLEQWSLVFGETYPLFRQSYQSLVRAGVQFPTPTDRDRYAADTKESLAARRPVLDTGRTIRAIYERDSSCLTISVNPDFPTSHSICTYRILSC